MRHGAQEGSDRRKDNAEAQSAQRSVEKKRRREGKQRIAPGRIPKWNG